VAPLCRSDRRYVRDAQRYTEHGRLVYESFGPEAFWRTSGKPVLLDHEGDPVGRVVVVFDGDRGWWEADLEVEVADTDPRAKEIRRRMKIGTPVSVGFTNYDSVHESDPDSSDIHHYRCVDLNEVSILGENDLGYRGARIMQVRELGERQRAKPQQKRTAPTVTQPKRTNGVATFDDEPVTFSGGDPIQRTGLGEILGVR
jgi:phage head maturation protease